ncbi:MAG TPA: PspC domain-containing protein [Propionibacteriaceae bacterium]|jgi:phage shock protein C|nr:PspC domain-containing protein [Propionibacteriaceae bacterium]
MSSPYSPQQPKRLERSKSNRVLGGVCAGVANYLNMDPTLVRVLTVVISLFTGVPVILYIIALFVVPEEGSQPAPPAYPPVSGPQGQATGYSGAGYQTTPPQAAQSAYTTPGTSGPTQSYQQPPAPPASAEDSVWGTEGPPWEQRQPAAAPTGQPQPEPTAPSEPEAPIAPAAHEEDATESAPEPEGPEERPASEGDQQTDKS